MFYVASIHRLPYPRQSIIVLIHLYTIVQICLLYKTTFRCFSICTCVAAWSINFSNTIHTRNYNRTANGIIIKLKFCTIFMIL